MSAVRPILFSAPMVRALLAGDKTQTRRVLSPGNIRFWRGGINEPIMKYKPSAAQLNLALSGARNVRFLGHVLTWDCADGCYVMSNVTYAPGDLLWVRETFATDGGAGYRYAATHAIHELRKKKPGIHMPRIASRLTLEVTHVRVERLHDISEADAIAEGAAKLVMDDDGGFFESDCGTHRCGFAGLWSHINGEDSWDANPWVVAVTFDVHQINIDALLAQRARATEAA